METRKPPSKRKRRSRAPTLRCSSCGPKLNAVSAVGPGIWRYSPLCRGTGVRVLRWVIPWDDPRQYPSQSLGPCNSPLHVRHGAVPGIPLEFRLIWEIEKEADSPKDAAPGSTGDPADPWHVGDRLVVGTRIGEDAPRRFDRGARQTRP
jgi:hypothetical protein